MQILQVINRLNYGGAASLLAQWSTHQMQAGNSVDVCVLYSTGHFAAQLEARGCTVYNLSPDIQSTSYHPPNKYDPRLIARLTEQIRSGNYQIVHAHLFPTSLFVGLASLWAAGPRYVFSEHSVMNGRRRPWLKSLDRNIYRRYERIIAVSAEVRKALLQWLPELAPKVAVVPNAVDAAQFQIGEVTIQKLRQELGLQPDQKVVLYAGRLVEVKGVDILLDAVAKLPPEVPVKILLAGEGPQQESLVQQANAAGISERVHFLGLRRDIPALLNLADLVVLPSRWEGLPMILLEAMAAHKAIIATAVGGVPGVIAQGETGWLIPPENPDVLAEAMLTLLSSAQLRSVLGEGAYEVVSQHYSAQAAVQKLHNIYRSVLSQPQEHRSKKMISKAS